jgi:hypothetical protein
MESLAAKQYYSYMWLRLDGTPYYAGKGTGKRVFVRHGRFNAPKDKSRILIFSMLNEAEAFESEIALIELFGRKDLGTGCLHNRTPGGENPPKGMRKGQKASEETRRKLRESHLGQKPVNTGVIGYTNRGSFKVGHAGYKNSGNFTKGTPAWNTGVTMPSVSAKMIGNTNWRNADKKQAARTRLIKTIAWG